MVIFPQCPDCKNYIGKNKDGLHYCKAFQDGIPDDIFFGKKLHIENIEGDHGILYEEDYDD